MVKRTVTTYIKKKTVYNDEPTFRKHLEAEDAAWQQEGLDPTPDAGLVDRLYKRTATGDDIAHKIQNADPDQTHFTVIEIEPEENKRKQWLVTSNHAAIPDAGIVLTEGRVVSNIQKSKMLIDALEGFPQIDKSPRKPETTAPKPEPVVPISKYPALDRVLMPKTFALMRELYGNAAVAVALRAGPEAQKGIILTHKMTKAEIPYIQAQLEAQDIVRARTMEPSAGQRKSFAEQSAQAKSNDHAIRVEKRKSATTEMTL